ncbi:MAG: copper chaperone PCu(A)C [Paracoccaceae bacterium]
MSKRIVTAVLTALLLLASPSFADGIEISGAYARASSPAAKSAGAFMEITNASGKPDRLLAVRTDAARMAQIHENLIDAGGVASMHQLEGGIELRPGATIRLQRGGDHIMLMGLAAPLKDGDAVPLTLVFENAGEVTVEVPVDLGR